MTYRRLYLYLLIGSTLALAGVWWQSFRSWYSFVGSTPPLAFSVNVASATVSIAWDPDELTWFPVQTRLIPARRNPRKLSDFMGKFNFRADHVYHVAFPVWSPWLLFVTGGYAFVRVMERRSAAGKEKVLAARHAAEGRQ